MTATPVATEVEVPDVDVDVPQLLVTDRCDSCGAQAFVLTTHLAGSLMWCAHHFRRYEATLEDQKVLDNRSMINKSASPSS